MTTIIQENQNQIRRPLEVYAGLSARQNIPMTFSGSGDVKTTDTNATLTTPTWDMRTLADFQGEGFVLDGSCALYDATIPSSLENGKLGYRSDIGGTMTLTVTSTSAMTAVTIAVSRGSGTITANGVTYTARRIVVIPVNATSVTLTATSDKEDERIEIASITAGISIDFDNENLISVNLDLRSDLSIINPSWAISSIEIQAYWSDDISSAISNIGDDVPIWYYAGYEGDYSDTRNFYLSEAASMTNNVLTIKGEDASHKLEDGDNIAVQRLDSNVKTGWRTLYNWFVSAITRTGVKPVSIQSAPSASGTGATAYSMIMKDNSPRDYVADIMNQAHVGTFWPTFVDAGLPRVTWSKPTPKWDIYEEDCGDVTWNYDRNVAKIQVPTDSEIGVLNTATRSNTWTTLSANISIKKNVPQYMSFDDYYWSYKVAYATGSKFDYTTISAVKWTPAYTTKKVKKKVKGKTKTTWLYRPTLYGKRLTTTVNARSVTESNNRAGYTAEVNPLAIGRIYQGTTLLYPNYARLFERSNEGGSFVWKGNPKIQPRDVARFHRLDGTVENITIETLNTTHEGGGTRSTITYKKGIV